MSSSRLAVALSLALVIPMAAQAQAPTPPAAPEGLWRWGGFSLTTYSGRAENRRVEVDLFRAPRPTKRMIAEKRERLRGGAETRAWADAASCPALAALPESLAEIEPIVVGREVPIVEETPTGYILNVVADGPGYVIDAPAGIQRDWSGRVRLESSEGPVKAWVEGTLVSLVACWGDAQPKP